MSKTVISRHKPIWTPQRHTSGDRCPGRKQSSNKVASPALGTGVVKLFSLAIHAQMGSSPARFSNASTVALEFHPYTTPLSAAHAQIRLPIEILQTGFATVDCRS
jgi:hypothetical protein